MRGCVKARERTHKGQKGKNGVTELDFKSAIIIDAAVDPAYAATVAARKIDILLANCTTHIPVAV